MIELLQSPVLLVSMAVMYGKGNDHTSYVLGLQLFKKTPTNIELKSESNSATHNSLTVL